ncbi:MAG TPA: bifunctional 23S rRNA (guanine(2069)-N(7))-methyltransferase RlmK/23S rRNA (guanine(2445)-N(2))-methyltransferase RlmL [Gammaproteobacteria bacterium]
MSESLTFFVTCPKGIEDLLVTELAQIGVTNVAGTVAGVSFTGSLKEAYSACLWSRLASRVFMQLATSEVLNEEQLYQFIQSIDWAQHIHVDGTFLVSCNLNSSNMTNSHYAALKVKDAVADQFNDNFSKRPSVDKNYPDVRINLHINRNQAVVSLDLSGDPLHKRGYRKASVEAPMKENLAAAILIRAGWPNESLILHDLMCGSGTLLTEAASMALNVAPGLERDRFGFSKWKGHEPEIWQQLVSDAKAAKKSIPLHIQGYDQSPEVVQAARKNIEAAGFKNMIRVDQRSVEDCADPETSDTGMVIVNPPYGERLGEIKTLTYLYADLGSCWKKHYAGWSVALFTGNIELAKQVGLRAHKVNTLYNGALKCNLFHYRINEAPSPEQQEYIQQQEAEARATFSNRLKKNIKNLSRWLKRENIECYRLYDADIPEYAVAIDIYDGRVHVQEYEAPATVEPRKASQRLRLVMDVIPDVLGIDKDQVVLKTRRRQTGTSQYEKIDYQKHRFVVHEGGLKFYVDLQSYLDTGLFLDHRITRSLVRDWARNKHFLNLFAYTGSVSVYAAAGGAKSTTTIDMSNTYLDWAEDNFQLNGSTGKQHQFIQADCMQWLEKQSKNQPQYDLIFIDPPTFSNSKRMEAVFDVQKDHVFLIETALKLLTNDGLLVFSNNFRRFRMDQQILDNYDCENISAKTIPDDFKRNQKIHQCWLIKHKV